jgi:hypothetical protein
MIQLFSDCSREIPRIDCESTENSERLLECLAMQRGLLRLRISKMRGPQVTFNGLGVPFP